MRCTKCGKEFEAGTRPDGLPNGVGYELEDGREINVCTDCILQTTPDQMKTWCGKVVKKSDVRWM